MKTKMISTLIKKILTKSEPLERKASICEKTGKIKEAFDLYQIVHPEKANQLYNSMTNPNIKYKDIQKINPIFEELTNRTKLYYKQN